MAAATRFCRAPASVAGRPSRRGLRVAANAAAAVPPPPRRGLRLAAAVCALWQRQGAAVPAAATSSGADAQQQEQQQQLQQQQRERKQQQEAQRRDAARQLKASCAGMAALPLFASTTVVQASSSTQAELYFGLAKAVDVYLALLTVRVLLSWFRTIDWFSEPWNTLRQLTDPFLALFRGIVPAIGGIDLSPMLGFFLLNFVRSFLMNFAM